MAGTPPAALPPLTGAKLGIIALALAVGTFMQVLDSTIANVSLPTIAGNLGVASDESTWIITAFAVAQGIAVPLTGWLMGRFGVVRTFCSAVFLFTIASFLCGIAWSLPSLVVFRIMQGAVSGPMMPGSQALLISIFPPQRRAAALGLWSMTTLVAPIMGPVLGGWISDNYHWGWIFLINVPVGLLTAAVCWTGLKDRETPTRKLPIDTVGLMLLVVWVGALQVMLDLGKNADWFASTQITVLAIVAGIGFVAWVIWELTDANPTVDLRLFRSRNFAFGNIAFALGYAVFFANILLMPLWLQSQLGYTASWAGLVAAPGGAVAVVLTPLIARASGKIDVRLLASIAFIAFGISYWMRSGLTTQADLWSLIAPQLVMGVATGCFFLAMVTICLDRLPPEKMPSATGLSNFTRITAGAFSASIVTSMWDRRESFHQSRIAENVGHDMPLRSAMDALDQAGLDPTQAAGALTRQLTGQAYLLASTDLFWLSAVLCAGGLALVWLCRRPAAPSGPVAAD